MLQPLPKILIDRGSAKVLEDQLILLPPLYYGVGDGVSGLYLPQEGPRLFDGRTGGQVASAMMVGALASRKSNELKAGLLAANALLGSLASDSGIDLGHSELLPAAAFAVAGLTDHWIHIIQGADSLAVWEFKDGSVGGTPSQMFEYETRIRGVIAGLMQKHHQDRGAMWKEFRPILTQSRRACVNKTYAVINGQSEVATCWQEFRLQRDQVKTLLLFTDGLVPFERTRSIEQLAQIIITRYHKGGLGSILAEARRMAEAQKASSHEDFAEATAIALEF